MLRIESSSYLHQLGKLFLSFASHQTRCQPVARAIALRAVSLALAAAAYFLYFLMMISNYDRAKGYTITVLGWFIAATILFSLIGVEVGEHRKTQPHRTLEYTQNFFAGILAAALYILIAILLASYTASVRSLHLDRTDRRKVECTSIILRAVSFATILLVGAAVYSTIEDWSLMDALYFADYTVLTIGIGNIVPKTHLGRSLLFPYATAGIISLGLLITSVASFTNDMRNMKLKYIIEEARNAVHDQGNLEKTSNEVHSDKENQLRPVTTRVRFPKGHEVLNLHRIKSDFYRRSRWKELVLFLTAWFVLWLCSAAVFRRSEKSQGWSYFIALYFTYTSLTTIGYGDYYPTSNFGTVFFVFWSLIALPILTNLVAVMGQVLHRMLVFCSAYIWKILFPKAHMCQHHRHENVSQTHGEEGKNGMDNPSLHPEPRAAGTRNPSHNRSLSMTGHALNSAQMGKPESSSTGNELERFKSIKASAQYRLLLAEEIETLASDLRDESFENCEELCCTWARILPLLHVGEDNASTPYELTPLSVPKSEYVKMMKLMDPQKALSERNAEISWMLTLLVRKLCLDLRQELYEAI